MTIDDPYQIDPKNKRTIYIFIGLCFILVLSPLNIFTGILWVLVAIATVILFSALYLDPRHHNARFWDQTLGIQAKSHKNQTIDISLQWRMNRNQMGGRSLETIRHLLTSTTQHAVLVSGKTDPATLKDVISTEVEKLDLPFTKPPVMKVFILDVDPPNREPAPTIPVPKNVTILGSGE